MIDHNSASLSISRAMRLFVTSLHNRDAKRHPLPGGPE